jgi:hypothetical protein
MGEQKPTAPQCNKYPRTVKFEHFIANKTMAALTCSEQELPFLLLAHSVVVYSSQERAEYQWL